jgi:IS5 family transposase
VDADNPGVEIIHRGKYKTLTALQRRWLKRRQAIEPMIGHTKSDHRMDRCWLKGAVGDALHAISCAAGYNIRWLMRAILAQAAKAAKAAFLALSKPALYGLNSAMDALIALRDVLSHIGTAVRASLGPPLAAGAHFGERDR